MFLTTLLVLAQQLQLGEPQPTTTSTNHFEVHIVDQYEQGVATAELVLAGAHYALDDRHTGWSGAIVVPWAGQPLIPLMAEVVLPGQPPQPVLLELHKSQWLEVQVKRYTYRSSAWAVASHIPGHMALPLYDVTLHFRPELLPSDFTVQFAELPRGSMDRSSALSELRWHELQLQADITLLDAFGDVINTDTTPFLLEFQQTLPLAAYDSDHVYRDFQEIEANPNTSHNDWLTGWRFDAQAGVWYPHPDVSIAYQPTRKTFVISVPGLSSWTVTGDMTGWTDTEKAAHYYAALGMPGGPTLAPTTPAPHVPEVSETGKDCSMLGDGNVDCQGNYSGPAYKISKGDIFEAEVSTSLESELSATFGVSGSVLTRMLVDIEGELGARFKGTLSGGAKTTTTMTTDAGLTPGQSVAKDVLPCGKGPLQFVMVNKVYSIAGITIVSVPLYPSVTWQLKQSDDCCTGAPLSTAKCCDLHEHKVNTKSCN